MRKGKCMKRFIAVLLSALMLLCVTACSGSQDISVDMYSVYESFTSYLPEMVMFDENKMLNQYGIDSSVCPQAIVATCSDGLRSDEIWLIEAPTAETAKEIADLANLRVDREKEETKDYAPDQYKVVEKAEIITEGNIVVLIISPDVDALVSIYEDSKA